MQVRLKKPGKVYYDPIQKITFYGAGNITCKASAYVRKWISAGILTETEADEEEPVNEGEGEGEGQGEDKPKPQV